MSGSDNTFLGGLFIGVFIAFMYVKFDHTHSLTYVVYSLYGIFIVQVYIYSLHCKEDTKWLKCLVSVVMYVLLFLKPFSRTNNESRILETLHTALMFDQMYHYAVTGFGRLDIIEKIDW